MEQELKRKYLVESLTRDYKIALGRKICRSKISKNITFKDIWNLKTWIKDLENKRADLDKAEQFLNKIEKELQPAVISISGQK